MGQWGQFCGMLGVADSSKKCEALGTVLWNVKHCGQFCGAVGTILVNVKHCGHFC